MRNCAILALISATAILAQQDVIPTFKINLDDPPKMRFLEPSRHFKEGIIEVIQWYETNLISKLIPEHLATVIDYSFWLGFREYYLEMEGIANAVGIAP